jgi:hypothetical protein
MFDIPDAYAADPAGYYRDVRARLAAPPTARPPEPPPTRLEEPQDPAPASLMIASDRGQRLHANVLEHWGDLRLAELIDYACTATGVDKRALMGPCRRREIMLARRLFFWMAMQAGSYPSTAVGRALAKDHSTVLHGRRKFESAIADGKIARPAFDPEIARACRARYLAAFGRSIDESAT